VKTPDPDTVNHIQEELGKIADSSAFAQSERVMQFLRFVCGELIAGRAHRLSQFTVAVEALGQDASFDPGTDPLVRVEARRLRMKLLEYYDGEGRSDPVRLTLPKGQYAPVVEIVPAADARPPSPDDVDAHGLPAALLGSPAIAVLPFNNLSGDPNQDFFSDGLTDDIITGLAAFRCVPVIGRHSSFAFSNTGLDLKTVANELGVRYIVEGSVRRAAGRVRINAQLIDANLDRHLWAQRFDSQIQDIFAVQAEITEKIVTYVVPEFRRAEIELSVRKRAGNFSYWEELNRGIWHLDQRDEQNNREAQDCFKRAVALDPMLGQGFTWLSVCEIFRINRAWSDSPAAALETALSLALKGAALNPTDADCHRQLSVCLAYKGRHREAIEEARQSIALNPSNCEAYYALALATCFAGDLETSLAACGKCLRLNPTGLYLGVIYSTTSLVHLMAHDFTRAADEARMAIRVGGHSPRMYHRLALALVAMGDQEGAAEAFQTAQGMMSGPSHEFLATTYPFAKASDYEFILEGLRKCGWRDC
jgi:adenylate cyclase